jgi:predicted amidophosphoribosyltransferase
MNRFELKGKNWCPYCLRQMKALHGEDKPVHGDIGICRACGHTLVFNTRTSHNKLRKPKDEDWEWIETSESYLRLLRRQRLHA